MLYTGTYFSCSGCQKEFHSFRGLGIHRSKISFCQPYGWKRSEPVAPTLRSADIWKGGGALRQTEGIFWIYTTYLIFWSDKMVSAQLRVRISEIPMLQWTRTLQNFWMKTMFDQVLCWTHICYIYVAYIHYLCSEVGLGVCTDNRPPTPEQPQLNKESYGSYHERPYWSEMEFEEWKAKYMLPLTPDNFVMNTLHLFRFQCGSSKTLSDECCKHLDQMYENRRTSRNPKSFVLEPHTVSGPVRARDPSLANVFGCQSEMDIFSFIHRAKLSVFLSDQLLKIIMKVINSVYIIYAVYMLFL